MRNPWQHFLKFVYPAYVRLSRLSKNKSCVLTNETAIPATSLYSLQANYRDGKPFDFNSLKGKKVLIVNTASGCGFTEQFDQLQQLYKSYAGKLVVMAFPTNDFGEEKKGDEQIALFCRENFRVSFPLFTKSAVKKSKQQHRVYQWLSNPEENGWNSQAPTWNFCKYLIDEKGLLIGYYGTAIEPSGPEITGDIARTA